MKLAPDGHMRQEGAVYVITGERGAGKSTVCVRVVEEARSRGLTVVGIITRRSGPEPGTPREVVDLRSGESRPFGAQGSGAAAQVDDTASDPLTPGWEFATEVFAWASDALSQTTPCDLLVIDEVGPLELLGGRGWAKSLELLRAGAFRAALVVCRPGLLGKLEARVGRSPAAMLTVSPDNRDALPAAIVREVLG